MRIGVIKAATEKLKESKYALDQYGEGLMQRRQILIIAVLAISGCASMGGPKVTWPWTGDVCSNYPCTAKDASQTYHEAIAYCRTVHNHYERFGNRRSSANLGIAAVGTLAGSVISPIAKGTSATAWSGLSGATNALQASLDESFAPAIVANRLAEIKLALTTGASSFSSATSDDSKVNAAIEMAAACGMAPGAADKKSLNALTQ